VDGLIDAARARLRFTSALRRNGMSDENAMVSLGRLANEIRNTIEEMRKNDTVRNRKVS